jgi:hypothetical protein
MAEANFGFWGTTKITIPPNASFDSGVKFQPAIPGTTGFGVTTHQHRMGTRFRIWGGKEGDTAAAPVVDENNWAEPRLASLAPPLAFDGSNGLSYQCQWQNSSSETIGFGESALDEMCFLLLYYYPSHGFDICLDGNCFNRK